MTDIMTLCNNALPFKFHVKHVNSKLEIMFITNKLIKIKKIVPTKKIIIHPLYKRIAFIYSFWVGGQTEKYIN